MSDFSGNLSGDFDSDERMDAVFADVRGAVAPYLRPPGTAAAHATVRHRHRVRVVAGAVLAAALVLGPAVGVAVAAGRHAPAGGNGSTPTPSATTQTPDPTPSTSPGPSPSGPPGEDVPPDTRISLDELKNSTLNIPTVADDRNGPQSCAEGRLKFTNGVAASGDKVANLVGEPVYADVDGDGRQETVIRIACALDSAVSQVTAFAQDPDGSIRTVGQVVGSSQAIPKIVAVADAGGGKVKVDVGCCPPEKSPTHQWRTYGFDGQRFRQTGGPTTFPNDIDLTVTMKDLPLTKGGDGHWHVNLNLTIRERTGPNVQGKLYIDLPSGILVEGSDWTATGCHYKGAAAGTTHYECSLGAMTAGTGKSFVVGLTTDQTDLAQTNAIASVTGELPNGTVARSITVAGDRASVPFKYT